MQGVFDKIPVLKLSNSRNHYQSNDHAALTRSVAYLLQAVTAVIAIFTCHRALILSFPLGSTPQAQSLNFHGESKKSTPETGPRPLCSSARKTCLHYFAKFRNVVMFPNRLNTGFLMYYRKIRNISSFANDEPARHVGDIQTTVNSFRLI